MLFSIIIPALNGERTIFGCLQELLSQSYKDFEVIIIDSLSTDSTVKIASSFNDNRVRIYSQKDLNTYDGMNKGLDKAEGEWIYFLGCNDKLYNSDVLYKISQVVSHNDVDLVYGNVKIVGNSMWAEDGQIYDGEFSIDKLFERNICHQSIFYRKRVFDEVGIYNHHFTVCADWDFNHRCFSRCKTLYIESIIAYFYSGGISSKPVQDEFINSAIVTNLQLYYGYSIFNYRFKKWFPAILNVCLRRLEQRRFLESFYYLFASIYHSNLLIYCLKVFAKKVLNSYKQ